MSNEDFRRGVLEVLLMVNRNVNEMRAEVRQQITQLQQVVVDQADEASTQRGRMIEQASRHGVQFHEHEKAITQHDARIAQLERRLRAGLDNPVADAE